MLPPAPGRLSTTTGWPQRLGQLLRDGAREDVGGAARGERHDEADRLVSDTARAHCADRDDGASARDSRPATIDCQACDIDLQSTRCVWHVNAQLRSIDLRARRLDDPRVLRDLARDERANCSGVSAPASAPCAISRSRISGEFRILRHVGVPLRDDVLRRAGRREQAEPRRDVEARQRRPRPSSATRARASSAAPSSPPAPSACPP